MQNEIKYADLFCGIGAVHVALGNINATLPDPVFKCVFACDIDPVARHIYEDNHGVSPASDITKLDLKTIPDMDLLAAGFPCQAFSTAGCARGFSDESCGDLFFHILKVIDAKKPVMLFLENVPNLLKIHGGSCFETIMGELKSRGYHMTHQIVHASEFTPQCRDRLMMLGDLRVAREWTQGPLTDSHVVRSILQSDKPLTDCVSRFDPEQHWLRPVSTRRRAGGSKRVFDRIVTKTGRGGGQGQRVYSIDFPGPTICSRAARHIYDVDGDVRTLTVLEVKRMFGFPDSFDLSSVSVCKANQLLGNSIVVPAAQMVLTHILD
jgi:DNA (cytosine-5)-methyltransferase 1